MLFIIFIIHFFFILDNYYCKNIALPFKKLTIEDFNGQNRSINDLLSFNIYTNISMGTPPQTVAHFIEQKEDLFYYKNIHLSYNTKKYNEQLEEEIANKINLWYNTDNSSTFICNDGYYLIYSDIFYFENLNKSKIEINLKFNIYALQSKNKVGVLSFKNPSNPNYDYEMYFINEIKKNDLIKDYYFTFVYEENNNLFDYNNDLNLGTIIIGESPHQFNPDKYTKDEEIINNGNEFSLFINEVKCNSLYLNFSEENIQMKISLTSAFIKGSSNFRNEIDKNFFSEFINDKLCKIEYLEENIYVSQYIVYSCINNQKVQEQIKLFPTLYFQIKPNNLTFMFTYKDIFKLFNDRLYFLINFKDGNQTDWIVGELFLRKYLTSFNYDSKTISFYKNQVDEMNQKSQIPIIPENKEENETLSNINIGKIIRIIIEVLMFITIIIISILLVKKYKRSRKKRANELNDDEDYDYVAKENNEPILTENKDSNAIIN